MKPDRKPLLRRLLNFVILGGLVLALWPVGQNAYGRWSQRNLQAAWQREAKLQSQPVATPKPARFIRRKPAPTAAKAPRSAARRGTLAKVNWPLTRLIAPDIGLDVVVSGEADEETLRRGPAFVFNSAQPGQGNCAIAGHRNMYGSWFKRVDELLPQSIITLRTPRETFTYRVSELFQVSEADLTVLAPPSAGSPILTLITCTIPHTSDRVVVSAYRVEEPNT